MFRHFFFIIIVSIVSTISVVAQTQYAFRVSYANKNETSFDLSKPNIFLGSKALLRRSIQSIVIDSTDLPVVQKYIDSTLKLANGIFHSRSRWQNNCVILVNDTSNINLLRSISFIKNVRYVANFLSPIHFLRIKPINGLDNDVEGSHQLWRTTGGIGYYGDAYDQIKLANGDYLHDSGFRGKGKLIAVLDEGFNLVNTLSGFDSLRISGRIVDTYNFNLNKSDVYGYSSHGTQSLSTMAGILDGKYVGTAPSAQYALYVTENSGSEQPFEMDNLVAAMERADSVGADIITISLGYNGFNIGGLDASLNLSDIDGKSTIAAMGANMATKKGILVVASAGNDGATSTWGKILTPGDADSALTCGSVDINKILAPTSGKGPNASGIMKPDVCMLGAPGVVFNNSGTTSTVGGTSIATPELAGLAACLWESKPSATPYQLRKVIRESAHIATSPNNEMGYGVPNFAKAHSSLSKIIIDSFANNTIICYPNPVTDKINVLIIGNLPNESINWAITDVVGRTISGRELIDTASINSRLEISLPNDMPVGTYFLNVKTSKDNRVFTIQKH